jgi:hypothetical protein
MCCSEDGSYNRVNDSENADMDNSDQSSKVMQTEATSPPKVWRRHTFPSGTEYAGHMILRGGEEWIRDGHGIYIDKSGSRYEGEWKRDKAHGYGIKTFCSKGDKHEGMYVNDRRDGWGVYLWSNGDKYVGDWKGGMVSYDVLDVVFLESHMALVDARTGGLHMDKRRRIQRPVAIR